MNLFEYQGKRLYKDFSIPTPKSIFVSSISSISDNHDLNYPLVVKAQVQVGGRGKAGGIKVANNFEELIEYSTEIVIQGYNSSLTMLGGGNSGGGIQYDNNQTSSNTSENISQVSNDMDDEIPF